MPKNTSLPFTEFVAQLCNTYVVLYAEPLSDAGIIEATRVFPEGKDVYEDSDPLEPGVLILEFKCEGDKIIPHPMYWTDDPVEKRENYQYVLKEPSQGTKPPFIFEHTMARTGELYPTGAFELLGTALAKLRENIIRKEGVFTAAIMPLDQFITEYRRYIYPNL